MTVIEENTSCYIGHRVHRISGGFFCESRVDVFKYDGGVDTHGD